MLMETLLPELAKTKRNMPIKVWSAACSSGQEPYSISMITQEFQQKNPGALPGDVQVTGTDISPAILSEAKEGVYDNLAVIRGLSPERTQRFFTQKEHKWQINR
ncbi:hypothetical protein HUE57_14195 [Candidatus Reidiella endopervernicosa]|uniref:CheR-type methyltransferase domain-containing protein n=2 Tax=Candidatus Reidiella endopervernicosa TaxID=2738883 RepID=A0A6N0HY63_9GAMM|nr:hypothetical protein HUE57_14195 [Candidatus Reidiella endopervernicosa]